MGCPGHESTIAQVAKDVSCRPLRITSALIVNSEIGAVLSVMRRNVRWGVQYMDEEDQLDHSLIKSFKEIRSKIFLWQNQWHVFDPVVYLQPFLDIIQSDETSAPITGVALSSIYKFLTPEVLDLNTVNVADALHQIVDAVTSCRFEVTDPASEEVVLVKILQVLLACLKNKASVTLRNQHVCDMMNTCFQIVHQASSKSELLQRIARQTMHELVRCIFSHLYDVVHTEEHLTRVGSKQHDNGHTSSTTEVSQTGQNNDLFTAEAYGVPCMVEIFQFLCSLLNATNVGADPRSSSLSYDEDVPLFSLGLNNSAIELAGACFDQHPKLLSLVENDLCRSLMQYGLSSSPLILSTVCSIVLKSYHFLRVKLKLQLEAFFSSVLMQITQNKHGATYQQQEVAMETIVDLCRQPAFIYEMYANYDCDVSCSNMFEDLVNVLSKSAFPVNSPLSAIHVLALEGLVAMINGMSERTGGEVAVDYAVLDVEDYEPFWKVKCENYENPDYWVPYIRKVKRLKKKLMIGADRFNTDRKKGLQSLQEMRILPNPLDPVSVACFLRYTNGLDKNLIGDYLGNHDQFCVEVLQEFAKTFNIREMNLDTALRVFLETFRLPGDAQKIQRVVEVFSKRYYQQSTDILANKDAALLSYSFILLNTDQHNLQVKRKMAEDDFIRNSRRINGGEDLPREYLSELYHSICENEIRMTPIQGSDFPTVVRDNWAGLIHRSRQTVPYIVCDSQEQINNEMFAILSDPTVAALSVVLDHIEQEYVLQTCVNGFLNVAKIAACYRLEDVIDGLLVSLSKFTALLVPMSVDESILAFGNNTKARKSIIAVFTIANTYGDYIRSGWRNTVDCVLRLHKLGLLPTRLAIDAVDDVEQVSESDPEKSVWLTPPAPIVLTSSHSRKLSGLMGRFSEFLYYDTEKPAPQPSREQVEAHMCAAETVKSCHVNTIFTESTFLQSESLSNLARALILAAARSNEESAVFCLELLITVTLNNRIELCFYGKACMST